MRLLVISSLISLCAVSAPAHAENWRLASNSDSYPATVVLVDSDSVKRRGTVVTFWAQSLFEKKLEGLNINRAVEWMEADCAGSGYTIRQSKFYDGTAPAGEVTTRSKPYGASPGSLNEGMIKTACGERPYKSERIDNPITYADDYFWSLDDGY